MAKIETSRHEQRQASVEAFAARFSIDIEADLLHPLNVDGRWLPYLASQSRSRVRRGGSNYTAAQIDYKRSATDRVRASRKIAVIMADNRTELSYWSRQAPLKKITVHQGVGRLVVGNTSSGNALVTRIDSQITPEVIVAPDRFYAVEAVFQYDRPEPLAVSSFFSPPVDLRDLETYVRPGQKSTNERGPALGAVVPPNFVRHYEG